MERKQIELTKAVRKALEQFIKTGVRSVRLVNRAKNILALDTSKGRKAHTQDAICKNVGVSRQTVINARNDFLLAANVTDLSRRKKRETPPVAPKITGELEARIIALARGEVPVGYARWTSRLLAQKCVELQYSDSMSHMSISRLLKNAT